MKGAIDQIFDENDVLGPHVREGHYDLIGPDGEIILPQVWDTMIKPGYSIEMRMWPIPELEKSGKDPATLSSSTATPSDNESSDWATNKRPARSLWPKKKSSSAHGAST